MLTVRAYVHPALERKLPPNRRVEPFRDAEQAWLWTMAALVARHEGSSRPCSGQVPRPCDPDDVIRCLDVLYRHRKIDLAHARVLRVWGERGQAPDGRYAGERAEARLWAEALDRLEWQLRLRGIVVATP